KRIENMRHRWQGVLSKFVEETQSRSQGGDFQQVEVDETVVRKQKVGDTVAWQTFVGSKVRGQRKFLVLQKRGFANSLSKVRPSGLSAPPPLTTAEWQSFASEHLQSNTVVHTDGAQAYCAPVPNLHLRHDSVSHSTKKGGPYFTKNCTHKGVKKVDKRKSNLKTVAGTQCIDGTWTSLKRSCLGVNAKYPHKIEDHVREAQFHSWQGSADPWHTMGSVLRWHQDSVKDLPLCVSLLPLRQRKEIIEAAHLKTVATTSAALRNRAFDAAVVLARREVALQSALQNIKP
ncbi:unnamed protein product, partial [Symbiodinium sp. CCMP2456]